MRVLASTLADRAVSTSPAANASTWGGTREGEAVTEITNPVHCVGGCAWEGSGVSGAGRGRGARVAMKPDGTVHMIVSSSKLNTQPAYCHMNEANNRLTEFFLDHKSYARNFSDKMLSQGFTGIFSVLITAESGLLGFIRHFRPHSPGHGDIFLSSVRV